MNYIFEKIIETLHSDKERQLSAVKIQENFWHGDSSFMPFLLKCHPENDEYENIPRFNFEEIHYDSEKMLCSQLKEVLSTVYGGEQAVPSVRANMGCGIFATMFGLKQTLYKEQMPWLLESLDKDTLKNMTAADLTFNGEFAVALEHMEFMKEKLGGACRIFPPDLQGAFDIAHLVFGHDIFYELYDDPEFVHHLLDLSCEAIFKGMEAALDIIPDSDKTICHYNSLAMPRDMGGIKLSEDTSTLLSPEHIDEFVTPYVKKILNKFGGGYIHYCGSNEHLFNSLLKIENVRGVNFGNPEKHNMQEILRQLAAHDKVYYGGLQCENGNYKEFFSSILSASKTSKGNSILLLQQNCSDKNKKEISEAFRSC